MRPRRDIGIMLAVTFITWMGQRVTAVALPLVALDQTGSAWTTGLVGGMAGIPVITAGWWAGRLRYRLTSGRALSVVLLAQCCGLMVVPIGALVHHLGPVQLCAAGLITGAATALSAPGQLALISDIADDLGPGRAMRALVWQDFAHRITMFLGPPLGGLGVAFGGPVPLLWAEAAAAAVGAMLLIMVRRSAGQEPVRLGERASGQSIRAVLRGHPDIRTAIILSGIGGLVWFAFTLGLAIIGAETGRPGTLIAAGTTGYGIGSTATAVVASRIVWRLAKLPAICGSWLVLGAAFAVLGWCTGSLIMTGFVAAIGGAVMPIGIGALNAMITEQTGGSERRTAFAAQSVIHDGASSLGLTLGGTVIGVFGGHPVLLIAGLTQVAAGGWVLLGRRLRAPAARTVAPTKINS